MPVLLSNSTDPPATAQGEGDAVIPKHELHPSKMGFDYLLQLALELYSRTNTYPQSEELHNRAFELVGEIKRRFHGVVTLLRQIEQHCPCGARPESLNSHPHVPGCPVCEALAMLEAR